MATSLNRPRVIRIPGQRHRQLATKLLSLHPLYPLRIPTDSLPRSPSIKVVCISDTHNRQPDLPEGDILIHAGDLTENGSFDEIQSQLAWLNAQSHRHKIFVAGNHDVLLDERFLENHPERRYGDNRSMKDLDWGSVHYLCDSAITLSIPSTQEDRGTAATNQNSRTLTVYGSPWTPQYGVSAFQYPRDKDIFSSHIPNNTDIVISHGPPRLHLDKRGFHNAGCAYLAQEVARVRPRLVIFGHTHISYGREDILLDSIQQEYESILNNQTGWYGLAKTTLHVLIARGRALCSRHERMAAGQRIATFVNASVVGGGLENELKNSPVVVELC